MAIDPRANSSSNDHGILNILGTEEKLWVGIGIGYFWNNWDNIIFSDSPNNYKIISSIYQGISVIKMTRQE